jgi:hypothetical protein
MIVSWPLEAEDAGAQPKDAARAAAQARAMAVLVRRLIRANRNRLGAAELRFLPQGPIGSGEG